MVEYLDHKGKKIEKGFYKKHYLGMDIVYYFTGGYNKNGAPTVERECTNNQIGCTGDFVELLIKLSKKEVRDLISRGKWLEQKLSQ
jgi:hypothetical protein